MFDHNGLENTKSICYWNSLIQILRRLPWLEHENNANSSKWKFWIQCIQAIANGSIRNALGMLERLLPVDFHTGQQMDAHEAFVAWIDSLGAAMPSPYFQCTMIRRIKCLVCHRSRTIPTIYESGITLSVVHEDPVDIKSLLAQEFASSKVTVQCPTCKQNTPSSSSVLPSKLPPYLVIHISRSGVNDRKLQTPVISPHTLNFVTEQRRYSYRRMGMIFHLGSRSESGHYVCAVQQPQSKYQWVICDDRDVSVLTNEMDLEQQPRWTQTVYMLFYQRDG